MKPIKTRYAKKMVDGKCYGTIRINNNTNDLPPVLTRKEFQEGKKQGIVFLDNKTGKIVFDDEEKD